MDNDMVVTMVGPLLVLMFCLSQALRDVYFGHVFQGVDVFAVILLAFTLSTVIFGALTAVRCPAQFITLRAHIGTVLAMNVTTAVAWSCYFFALTHLEPAIVNTVHSGMGPLTVVALAACGVRLAQPARLRPGERWAHGATALSIVALSWVVLSGRSALGGSNQATDLIALLLLMVGGASITLSLLYSKRLHDLGVSAEAVTAVRYVLLILLAAGVEALRGSAARVDDPAILSLASIALIVLPLFALQAGVALTAPLTAQVIRALGPVFVFMLQQFDGRLIYSRFTLAGILVYSAAAIAANLAHGWRTHPAAA